MSLGWHTMTRIVVVDLRHFKSGLFAIVISKSDNSYVRRFSSPIKVRGHSPPWFARSSSSFFRLFASAVSTNIGKINEPRLILFTRLTRCGAPRNSPPLSHHYLSMPLRAWSDSYRFGTLLPWQLDDSNTHSDSIIIFSPLRRAVLIRNEKGKTGSKVSDWSGGGILQT